jgi:radical SAM superfamily enzyme YgiQ (UPF0313 family)
MFLLAQKYGVEMLCSAMLGNPGETRETVQNTIRYLDSLPGMLYTNFSIANPYPGTEMLMWAQQGKYGLRLNRNGEEKYHVPVKYTRYDDSPIEVNDLTASDLVRYQALGLLRLHLRPKRFIAAIRMIGFWALVPVFIKMVRRQLMNLPEALRVFLPKRSELYRNPQIPGECR